MNKGLAKLMGRILLAGAPVLIVLPACGGSVGEAGPIPTAPQSAPTATSRAVAAPNTSPAGPTDSELLARGKLIYEKTAGGVGCASCHGLDGSGSAAGTGAPDNRGAPEWKVREVLASAPAMSFIKLTDEEITAVVAYLKYLGEQP